MNSHPLQNFVSIEQKPPLIKFFIRISTLIVTIFATIITCNFYSFYFLKIAVYFRRYELESNTNMNEQIFHLITQVNFSFLVHIFLVISTFDDDEKLCQIYYFKAELQFFIIHKIIFQFYCDRQVPFSSICGSNGSLT